MYIKSSKIVMGVLLSAFFCSYVQAEGKIVQIDFSGPDDPNHPNIVQLMIEGGFSSSGSCDPNYAAIRNTADRKHLISFALTAYASGQSVNVFLNPLDNYFGTRCTVARISNR